MRNSFITFLVIFILCGCGKRKSDHHTQHENKMNVKTASHDSEMIINPEGKTITERINPPLKFKRTGLDEKSFGYYLRHLSLKPHNAKVEYYNGDIKPNRGVYIAVVDLDIGNKNLHQCADAIMRLRGEYLYSQKAYDKIHFNFTNGFRVDYNKWMDGNRVVVDGNETYWRKSATASNTYDDFWNYMEMIFIYAGTLSLEKELQPVPRDSLTIGDVFIQGGSPGHAVIVVDVAVNPGTNQKVFLLAQSYMPAQEIQILQNPNDDKISPWYSADFRNKLVTPEWTFNSNDLKRFENQ